MSTPRAVTVATRIYEPENGAAAYRLGALVRALDGAGYTTTVLTTRPPVPVKAESRVRRWPVLRDATGAVRGYLQYASFDIPLFFRLLFAKRVDLVVVEPPPTTGAVCRVVCAIRRIPYVYFSADVSWSAAAGIGVNKAVVSLLRAVEGWVLRGAAAVLAVSDGVRDQVLDLDVDEQRVTVVGTGIDVDTFSAEGPMSDVDYPYFVYAGTMSEIHGAEVFIDAFHRIAAKHPTARLMLFGQGVEVQSLKARVRELGTDRIEFPGLVDGREIARWLRGARAGLASVRPHRGYDFAFATKALVALSCGSPVIYAGVGPLHNLIRDNSLGWAAEWDVAQVAEAMDDALELSVAASRRGTLSEWVETNFSLARVGSRAVSAIDMVFD